MSIGTGEAEAEQQRKINKIHPLLLAIPASCDFTASTLMFVALTMVPASVYQMMRGIIVVITAFESVIFLNRKLYRHHWTAIALIVLGVAEVGIVAIRAGGGGSATGSEFFGIILILVA